jgi:Concanavalin A-like lectin/glucanases superfamily
MNRIPAIVLVFPTLLLAQDYAISLNGIDAYGSAAGVGGLVANSTWEAWVRIPTNPPAGVGGRNVLFRWGMYSHGAPVVDVSTGVAAAGGASCPNDALSSPGALLPGTWHHVAAQYEAQPGPMTVYVDGVEVARNNTGVTCSPYAGWTTLLGASGYVGVSAFLQADIDEARISNVVRYNGPFTPQTYLSVDSNTVGLWHFDEGAGNVAYDSSSNGRHFTLHGGYSWSAGVGATPVSAAATIYGTGCGSPALTFTPTNTPVIGTTGTAEITNSPTIYAGASMGWSNTSIFPLTLPFELTMVGMPGCYLLQSNQVFGLGTTPGVGGTIQFTYPVPFQPSLLGGHVYLQAYAYAPGANALEFIASNGIDWLIGNQ